MNKSHSALKVEALAVAALLAMGGLAVAAPETAEQTVRALEQLQDKAALAGDVHTLQRIFADDYQMVNPAGAITTREQLLALLTGPTHPYKSAVYTTDVVRDYGSVIVTIGREDVVANQGPLAGQLQHRRVTQVWVRQKGTWRLSIRHAMVIPPA